MWASPGRGFQQHPCVCAISYVWAGLPTSVWVGCIPVCAVSYVWAIPGRGFQQRCVCCELHVCISQRLCTCVCVGRPWAGLPCVWTSPGRDCACGYLSGLSSGLASTMLPKVELSVSHMWQVLGWASLCVDEPWAGLCVWVPEWPVVWASEHHAS